MDNIIIYLREIGQDVMDRIDLEQWRPLVNTLINFRVP
jgi:hypothetical protein